MLSDVELLDRHVATLFRHDSVGRLLAVNELEAPEAPRVCLGRSVQGIVWRVRHDLPATLARELVGILATERVTHVLRQPPAVAERLRAKLVTHAPVEQTWSGPAWEVPAEVEIASATAVTPVTDGAILRSTFPWLAGRLAHA